MIAAIIYKNKIYIGNTHCRAYIELEKQLGRKITVKELKGIESGYISKSNKFSKG